MGKQEETSIPSILVTGATGTFGAAVAEMLQQAGEMVRVLIRDPARFSGEGVQVAIGDFADPTSLDAALSGVERVFLASFDRPEMLALQRNLVEAAQRQGVRHISRISSMGVENPHLGPIMADHAAGERQIEQSGLAFTHLRPSWVPSTLDVS